MAKCQDPNCNCRYGLTGCDREAFFESCDECGKTPSQQADARRNKESEDQCFDNWNPYPFDD